ncbi:hypothetical protein BGW39_010915 [Mortierella sp. 14UC]|nr:hypothetical protein BGW39_010915 [Mortierella sp. 14UC]
MTSVQRTLASSSSQPSMAAQETDGEGISTSNRQETSLATIHPTEFPASTLEFSINTNIRRLELRGLSKDIPIYVEVIKSCSLLEDLHLRDEVTALSNFAWIAVALQCPHLRALRLTGQESKLLISNSHLLVTLFPELEELYLHVHWTDWGNANIDDSLADHGGAENTRHPLKTLSIANGSSTSLLTLLRILSARSLAVETLMVGSLSGFQGYFETFYHPPTSISRFLADSSDHDLQYPWLTLRDTLTRLDLHTTVMATKHITTTFFQRLQGLHHLRALCVSTKHIHDWTPTTFCVPDFTWKGPLPIAQRFIKNRTAYNTDFHNGYTNMPLPVVNFSFPSLRDVVVKSSRFGVHRMVTATQAIFVLATAPALERFVFEKGSIDENTLADLKGGFPKQFVPISKKDLAWIETVHGF